MDVLLGDCIEICDGLRGVVEAILEDSEWVKETDDPVGIYVLTESIGLVRVSSSDRDVRLLKRAKKASQGQSAET